MSLIEDIAEVINIDDLPAEVVKQIVASGQKGKRSSAKSCAMPEDDKEDMDEDD